MSGKKIGNILLESGLISKEQLEEAISEHSSLDLVHPLGRTLVKMGFVSEEVLQRILEEHDKRLSLAETILINKFIPKEDIDIALEMCANENLPLEKVLLNLEFISEENLAKVMALYADRPLSHLDNRPINIKTGLAKGIISFSPEHHVMVPVAIDGRYITIAMNRPLPFKKLLQLEDTLKLKVATIIVPESEIRLAQQRFSILPGSGNMQSLDRETAGSIMDILATETVMDVVEDDARHITESDSLLVKLVNKIIIDAYDSKASDIHVEPNPGNDDILIRTRIDGVCTISQRLPSKYKYAIPSRIKIMADMDIAERRKPQDGKIDFKKFGSIDLELRVATMPALGHVEDVAIRLLHTGNPRPFDKLMLTPRNKVLFESAIRKPYGMILVVGPTGSGKTTTLHSSISLINTPDRKILTAEDPVEITQKGLRQLQVNPKIGLTFAAALRSFLRMDPDVIMVGEMRDIETSGIAIEASLTGHLVFSTLHTNSAAETVTRLLDMGLDPFSFSDSLLCILAQRMVRTLCDSCKETYKPGNDELMQLIDEYGAEAFAVSGINMKGVVMARPVGCDYCKNTGYKGRMGVHELLECSSAMKGLIRKKAESTVIRSQATLEGMTTLKQDGILKVLQGITDIREIRKVCVF